MSVDLRKISKGKLETPPRWLVYGADGVGKTSFAAGAPGVFFLDANKGSHRFNVDRVNIDAWEELFEWLEAIENKQVKCGTVVLDDLSTLEAMSHVKLFPGSNVTEHGGGFNKGDDVVIGEWRNLLSRLERLWIKGHAIGLVGHSRVRKFEAPDGPGYDRYELALRPPLAGLLRQWCDYVVFAQVHTSVVIDKKTKAGKGTTTGERFISTRRTPAFDAKARGTALFPEMIPLSFESFGSAIRNDGARVEEMTQEIDAMLKEIGDAALDKAVRDYMKRNPTLIAEAFNRVKIRLSEKTSEQHSQPTTEEKGAAA